MLIKKKMPSFRSLQWKLTLSYSAVTVGSLFVVVLILGYLVFSKAFIPIEIYNQVLTPEEWIRIITENDASLVRSIYLQDPIDTDLISNLMQGGELTITELDLFQIGDFQIQLRTEGRGSTMLLDHEGILLGLNNPGLVPGAVVGQPLDRGIFPGLEGALTAALNGEFDPEKIFVTLEPNERFYFAVPVTGEDDQEVLGAVIIYVAHLPTASDIPETLTLLMGRSVLFLLLSAAVVGTIFGSLTARGMVQRFGRVSQVTDSWSQGDFSRFIDDSVGDEISQMTERLNHMAKQLQQFLKRSRAMAVSEERNRLARDLHDSAKQEALAASFHLGTALTLFDRDPESAKKHLVEADILVDSVRGELTDLIHELRPPAMDGARFDEIINEYIIEWAHQTGIEATLEVDGFFDLALEVKHAIYRILQEALANVTRHSSAGKVVVTMCFRENSVEFCIIDDGVGFDTQRPHDGMGLDSMRERVESLEGDLSIESNPDHGTNICVTIPIEEQ
jgi:NarL family two-component system sensor histidine kinase LiaS